MKCIGIMVPAGSGEATWREEVTQESMWRHSYVIILSLLVTFSSGYIPITYKNIIVMSFLWHRKMTHKMELLHACFGRSQGCDNTQI